MTDSDPASQTTSSVCRTLRWDVARLMIRSALKIAPTGIAKERVTAVLWAAEYHARNESEIPNVPT